MKNVIYYATSNPGKFTEVKTFLDQAAPEIELRQFDADLPEMQTLDQKAIALQKAKDAYAELQKPILVDDSAIYLEAYHEFPGTMTKFVHKSLGFDGIFKLIDENNRAYFKLHLVYVDGPDSTHIFDGICKGHITKNLTDNDEPTLPWDSVFVPDGTKKTYAQLREAREEENYFYRIFALKKFLAWYKERLQVKKGSSDENHSLRHGQRSQV